MTRSLAAAVWLALLVDGVASGGEERGDRPAAASAPSASTEERIRGLVRNLAAETLAARTTAERELLALGPEALRWLPAPEELPAASMREGVRRIRIALERRKAADSLKPSSAASVAALESPTAEVALDALGRETGNAFRIVAPAETLRRPVRLGADRSTFWKALDAVTTQAGLRLDSEGDGLRVASQSADEPVRRDVVDYPGAFRISTTEAALRPLIGGDGARLLRVRARLAAEPRLRPLLIQFAAAEVEMSGTDGVAYRPYTPDAKYELTLTEGTFLDLAFDAIVPANEPNPKTIDVTGRVTVTVAAGTEPFEFSDLTATSIARRRGGVTVRLKSVEFEAAGDDARRAKAAMSVAWDVGGPAFESHRTWIYFNRAWLTTKDGARVPRDAGLNVTAQPDGGLSVEYGFSGLTGEPRDYRFVYEAPTLIVAERLPFALRRVPIRSDP